MTEEEYKEVGRHIWQSYVPDSGQADSVQGELLRAIVKLRDEAHRNGNANWDIGHETLANFIKTTVLESRELSWFRKRRLKRDIHVVLNYEEPYLEDDVFDRIERVVLDWCVRHPQPIPKKLDPNLRR